MISRTFQIEDAMWQELQKTCREQGFTASAAIRIAIKRFLIDPTGEIMQRGLIAKKQDDLQGWLEDQITDLKEQMLDSLDTTIDLKINQNKTLNNLRQSAEAGRLEVV